MGVVEERSDFEELSYRKSIGLQTGNEEAGRRNTKWSRSRPRTASSPSSRIQPQTAPANLTRNLARATFSPDTRM